MMMMMMKKLKIKKTFNCRQGNLEQSVVGASCGTSLK
jgi:hypothetical protein